MKRCYPTNPSYRRTTEGILLALVALLTIGANAKPAEAADKWGIQGKAKKLEDNEVMFYRRWKFDEWGGKRLLKLAPGQRCAVVGVETFFGPWQHGDTVRSIRLGKKVGVVLRRHDLLFSPVSAPYYQIITKDIADIRPRSSNEAIIYLKTGGGEPPGVGFSNFPPLTLHDPGDKSDMFIAAGESVYSVSGLPNFYTLRKYGLLYMTIHGPDTRVLMFPGPQSKKPSRVLTTKGKDRDVVKLSANDLVLDRIEITVSPLSDTAKVADQGAANVAGAAKSDVPHEVGAVTSAGKISGKWEGNPISVEFSQTGEIIGGAVAPNNFGSPVLQGTLTKNVLDFWFGGPDNLMFGQLTFAADGMSAQGYFQNTSSGAKKHWVLKRLGGSIL